MSKSPPRSGRTAVITGAAMGIGLAASKRFASIGMRVCMADVDAAALRRASDAVVALAADGADDVLAVVTDVSKAADIAALKVAVDDRFGDVGLLMNNAVSRAGGGILLYLAQEGRGIGLAAKIKAYALQDQGFDTLEANLRLGFEADERLFAPAAKILKYLNIDSVRLLTNNPEKAKALEGLGIKVTEMVGHAFPPNPHNENYLRTKRDKAGHRL